MPELLNGGYGADLHLVLLPLKVLVAARIPKCPTGVEMVLGPHDDLGDGADAGGEGSVGDVNTFV